MSDENLDSHFERYSQYSQTNHDNIDEDYSQHSHTHKHSSNGEEHEHEHEHSQGTHVDLKILKGPTLITINRGIRVLSVIFYHKLSFSNPHLLAIFRPPIV